jgi:hypothetical protein
LNNIARVFPRKTKASPDDALAFFGEPPRDMPKVSEVHVSVTFTYDLPKAENLAEAWRVLGAPVKLGGPATGERGGDFTPGMYLKPGYGITRRSRKLYCYVLIGFRDDTFDAAEHRLREAWDAGFFPFAMLYRAADGETERAWRKFQSEWVHPSIVAMKLKTEVNHEFF